MYELHISFSLYISISHIFQATPQILTCEKCWLLNTLEFSLYKKGLVFKEALEMMQTGSPSVRFTMKMGTSKALSKSSVKKWLILFNLVFSHLRGSPGFFLRNAVPGVITAKILSPNKELSCDFVELNVPTIDLKRSNIK